MRATHCIGFNGLVVNGNGQIPLKLNTAKVARRFNLIHDFLTNQRDRVHNVASTS